MLVKIRVRDISYDLKEKEEHILKNAEKFFPNISEQGRLKVELGVYNYSWIPYAPIFT